jgi:hypothetical protein
MTTRGAIRRKCYVPGAREWHDRADSLLVTICPGRFNLQGTMGGSTSISNMHVKKKLISKKAMIPLVAGGVALGVAAWFWATTFVSIGYWNFPESCPLHHVGTHSEFVPNHGFVTVSHRGDWVAAKQAMFPLDTFNGGYGHPNRRYQRILRKYCPECREARKAWTSSIRPRPGADGGPVR